MYYLKTEPYGYQREALEFAYAHRNCALFMEQGTGKSLVAIGTLGYLKAFRAIDRTLIISPASVIPVWEQEFRKHADFPYVMATLDKGTEKNAKRLLELSALRDTNELKVAVINYEAVWRIGSEWGDYKPDSIICDESQRIKNFRAKQSRFIHSLGRYVHHRMILTGTPVTQGPLDVWSQYKFLAPWVFPSSYYAFRNRYAKMGGYLNKQVTEYKNLGELSRKTYEQAYRITKKEALDLPEQVFQNRYVSLPSKVMREYRRLVKEDIAFFNQGCISVSNALTRLMRLQQITGGHAKSDEGIMTRVHTEKLKELRDILDEVAGKVVVFCRFIPELHEIEEMLRMKETGFVSLHGGVPNDERGEIVRRFQEDPDCRVFVAQAQTAGLGITLTSASTAVFYSMDYSYANYDQCCARIHRIGQKDKCTYIHLVAKDTIDLHVLRAVREKEDLARSIIDDWRKVFKLGDVY